MQYSGIQYRTSVDVELVQSMGSDEDIAKAAWVSTVGPKVNKHLETPTEERITNLIGFLMRGRHGSPFEHNSMTFLVRAPIFVWREHHRHRIGFSYNEESGRYKQMEPEFYIPGTDRGIKQVGKPGKYEYIPDDELSVLAQETFIHAARDSYQVYTSLLNQGVAREVARMYLPLALYSSCFVTTNARALMNFLSLRVKDTKASYFPSYPMREIEMVAREYEAIFAQLFPITHAVFVKNGRVAP